MSDQPQIGRSSLFAYSILALPLAFAGMPLYLYAPDFYATNFGMSLGTLGAILLAIRLIDAFQDPMIGWFSDRNANGRPLIVGFGILLLGTSFFMLFHPNEQYLSIWFFISMFLLTTSFSILSINLNAVGGVWTKHTHDKTRITVSREMFGLIGVMFASALPAYLQRSNSTEQSFHIMSLVFIVLVLTAGMIFLMWLLRFNEPSHQKNEAWNIRNLFAATTKSLRRFYLIYFVSMLASAVPLVLVVFYVRDHLNAEQYIGLFLITYFLAGVLGMPIWQAVAKKKGKLFSWAVAMAIAISVFSWAYFLNEGDIWQYIFICIGSGFTLGAELALPPSILSDLLDETNSQTRASTQFSFLTFLSKSALALATGIILPFLEFQGYQPNMQTDCCNPEISQLLSIVYAAIPCAIKIVALFLLWSWYKQSRESTEGEFDENQNTITYRSTHNA